MKFCTNFCVRIYFESDHC
ncbi:hypothetical protein Taro_052794 [Colocasia esculenta]|uniref:Uncharacterized protein n=1 Tax=Colocasia esculenta TaxID=4460 RepID=A0A843XKP4_COLES|nr:hypothetical protein [Colocasia esculenta]